MDLNYKHVVLISLPLVLSLFTHLFNPVGFPCLHPDEGKYVRRALYVLDNGSPQDPTSRFDHGQSSMSSYDHPHFAQLLLAGIFKIIGYPSSLNPIPTIQSIEMLYTVPRVLMGLFAVVDTFLLYKIVEFRYDRRVAFIASILFAVMPITWLLRRVYLDSILMPFLLSSILFALYTTRRRKDGDNSSNLESNKSVINQNRNIVITATLSGILLGISIYTKIPALTLIPLVVFLIYSSNKKFKTLALWFIPVIVVPLLWPAYAISVGQFGEWMNGVFWQATEREDTGITRAINMMFLMDPVLIVLSVTGIIFAGIKRDLFILLWVIPFIIFAFFTHWVFYFHFILLLPVFCIATALFITNISKRILKGRRESYETVLAFSIVSGIGIFGLTSMIIIITTNVSFAQLAPVAFAAAILEHNGLSSRDKDDITIITAPEYSWIFKYAFDNNNSVQTRDSSTIKTEKILLIVDRSYLSIVSTSPKVEVEDEKQIERLQNIYNNSYSRVALMNSENTPINKYPFTNIQDCFTRTAEIKTNY